MTLFVKGWRCEKETHIGYYMAARRYEISLRVLNVFHDRSERVKYFSTRDHLKKTKPFHLNSFQL